MIADTLDHIALYRGLQANLDRGLDFLLRAAREGLPDGRHDIDGPRVYAVASSYRTHDAAANDLEAHRSYIDIQYLLSGSETMYWTPFERCTVKKPYADSDDIMFLAGVDEMPITLRQGLFVVLFPQDAHKPGCVYELQEEVRKLVIKALVP